MAKDNMEDYKKKYEDIVGLIKKAYLYAQTDSTKAVLEEIFPELKESEDKKTKRMLDIITYKMSQHQPDIFTGEENEWFNAWLEKQGEKNTIVVIPKFRVGDVIRPKGSTAEYTIESISGECYHGKGWGLHISCDDDYELVEQKTNDKVEPKFNVGAWVVFDEKHESVYQIEKIENFQYTLRYILGGLMPLSFSREDMIRAWTIQDAKAGDVLVTGNKNIFIFKSISDCTIYDYCGLYFGKFWEEPATVNGTTAVQLPIDYVPATKEQRDQLEKAMADAGYIFSFDKKELRKLKFRVGDIVKSKSQPMLDARKIISIGKDCYWCEDRGCIGFAWEDDFEIVKQKPAAWSEEDEGMLNSFLHKLEVCDILSNKEIIWIKNKFKSLRPQNRWKPTEEQLKSLARAGNRCISVDDAKILTKLLEQLKKL